MPLASPSLRSLARRTLAGAALVLGACSTDPGPTQLPDAGGEPPATNPATVCDNEEMPTVEFDSAGKASLSFDTRDSTLPPRDMGPGCNNEEAHEWAPQYVLKATIPGSGPKVLGLSTRVHGTDKKFANFVQVREACEQVPAGGMPPACFGPGSDDVRAAGALTVEGGKTYYLFVTGYSEAPAGYLDRGPVKMLVTVTSAVLPTLDQAQARIIGPDLLVSARVRDGNRGIAGLSMEVLTADDKIVDVNGDGARDVGDLITAAFSPAPGSVISYDGSLLYKGAGAMLSQRGATKIRMRAFDVDLGMSDPQVVPLESAALAKIGEACDADHVCSTGIPCTGGTCTAPDAVVAACEGFKVSQLGAPRNGQATSVTETGVINAGGGLFVGSCAPTNGREAGYAVDVPAEGKFDLIARTNLDGIDKRTDTAVYIRSTCAEPFSELACSDEVAAQDSRSMAIAYDVPAGRHYAFVEAFDAFSSGQLPYLLQLTLRPVLPAGASCDVTEAKNRCDNGHCLVESKKCP